jgi:hypothetical protein
MLIDVSEERPVSFRVKTEESTVIRNVAKHLPNYMASHLRRHYIYNIFNDDVNSTDSIASNFLTIVNDLERIYVIEEPG